MVTLFSIPKAFHGHAGVIQSNAIKSWLSLVPRPEIILLGDDEGVKEAAEKFGVKHIADIKKNDFGTPRLDYAFNEVQKTARHGVLTYINADIILVQNFMEAVNKIEKLNMPAFLGMGRRTDINIAREITFDDDNSKKIFKSKVLNEGSLHGFSGIDYFIFPKTFNHNLPPFPVGRPGWDNWFIFSARKNKVPVIDCTEVITAIHQNHAPAYRALDPEVKKSIEIAGGFKNMMTIRDSDWLLTSIGLKKPPFIQQSLSRLTTLPLTQHLLGLKRYISRTIFGC